MAYTKFRTDWRTGSAGNTPITAAFLDYLEGELVTIADVADAGGVGGATLPALLSSDYASLQLAIDAVPEGGELWIDQDYTISTALTVGSHQSLTIKFLNGAKLIQGADDEVISFFNSLNNPVDMSALTTADVIMTSGDSISREVAQFTVASVPSWLVAGARIKVAADDAAPGTFQSGGSIIRLGEFATVHEVSGTTVTLESLPYQWADYVTTPRIAEGPRATIRIDDMEVHGGAAGVAGEWTSQLVELVGYSNLALNRPRIRDANSKAITLTSIDGGTVFAPDVDNAEDDSSNGQYGYGIGLVSCEHVNVIGGTLARCRHGFTTDSNNLSSQQSHLTKYGRTKWCNVIGATGLNCSAAAFDTHTDAYECKFIGCTDSNSWRGSNGGGSGFQVRGHKVECHSCTSTGSATAFYVTNQGAARGCEDARFVNCIADSEQAFITILSNGTTLTGTTIEGGRWQTRKYSRGAQIDGAKLRIKGGEFYGPSTNNSSMDLFWLINAGAEIESTNSEFDISDISGSPKVIDCRTAGAAQTVTLLRPTIRQASVSRTPVASNGDTTPIGYVMDAYYPDQIPTNVFSGMNASSKSSLNAIHV